METVAGTLEESVATGQLARILSEHGAALARAAASYARSDAERADLLQDVALALFRALPSFRGECSERAFALRVAHNQGITFSTRRRPPAEDLDAIAERTAGPDPDPESALAGKQRSARLQRAIHALPLAHRQVVTLLLEDLSHEEIAAVLGISAGNVAVRLHRARRASRRASRSRGMTDKDHRDEREDLELESELDGWREDWQGVAGAPPADLIDRVRTLSREQTRAAIGEVGASIFLVVMCAWLALRSPIAPVLVLSGALFIYVGVWLTYFFTIRVGSWGAAGASVREWVERSRRLHRIDVRWARFSRACIVALAGLIVVWSPWLVAVRWERYRSEPWRGVVGFGTASLILVATWAWNRRKLARAIAARDALEERVRGGL